MTAVHTEPTPGEAALWAALIVLVILLIVMFFCCCLPVWRTLKKRYRHWDDLDNDPRWARDTFQFSPTSPQLDPKYNRLSASSSSFSRSSSFRVNKLDRMPDAGCQMPRVEDQVEIKMPPAYTDLFAAIGEEDSLGTPPLYYSHSPSEEEVESINNTENDKKKEIEQKKTNKSYKKVYSPIVEKVEPIINTENDKRKEKSNKSFKKIPSHSPTEEEEKTITKIESDKNKEPEQKKSSKSYKKIKKST